MSPWISDLYLRSQTDARLLSLTRDGHGRAFAVLAERYRPELLGQARRLSSSANAEDLLQQTMLSAFAALNRGAEVGHVRGWLHAILRNAATRARGPVEAPLELALEAGESPDALLEARADARLVLSALDELPARQREALVGSTVQGLSRAELATTLGVSEGAVRQLVHRARSAVRMAITSVTPYPVIRWLTGDGGSAPAGSPELALGTGVAGAAGAAGAGGLVAKLGMVAAAGAIAASGLAVAGHHATRASGHAGHRVHANGDRSSTIATVMTVRRGPLATASGSEFITTPTRTGGRADASTSPGSRSRPRHPGTVDRSGQLRSSRGQGRGGTRAADGASVSGHVGGSRSGDGGGLSRPSSSDGGSGGSGTGDRGPSDASSSSSPAPATAGSSPNGSRGRGGSGDGGSGSTGGGSGDGTSGSGGGGSGTGSGATTTTAAPTVSSPAATTASGGDGVSGGGGSTDGGGSGTATPGSSGSADGSQTAAMSTTSSGSRDLLPPPGSSVATDH